MQNNNKKSSTTKFKRSRYPNMSTYQRSTPGHFDGVNRYDAQPRKFPEVPRYEEYTNKYGQLKKSFWREYVLYSKNGEMKDVGTVIPRGIIVRKSDGTLMARAPNAPFQISICDPQFGKRLANFHPKHVMQFENPFGASQVLTCVLEGADGKYLQVSTNQCMNAFHSKFGKLRSNHKGTSNELNECGSLGALWEAHMKANGYYENYLNFVMSKPVGTMDVWWLSDSSRLGYDYFMLAMSIDSDGNIMSTLDSNVNLDVFDPVGQLSAVNVPGSICILGTIDTPSPNGTFINVNELVTVRIVNSHYSKLEAALSNNPDTTLRVISLVYMKAMSGSVVADHMVNLTQNAKKYDIIERELQLSAGMDYNTVVEHLDTLIRFVSKPTLVALFLFERLIDNLLHAYSTLCTRINKTTNFRVSYNHFWDSAQSVLYRRFGANVPSRMDAKMALFGYFEPHNIATEVSSELMRLNKDYTVEDAETQSIKTLLHMIGGFEFLARSYPALNMTKFMSGMEYRAAYCSDEHNKERDHILSILYPSAIDNQPSGFVHANVTEKVTENVTEKVTDNNANDVELDIFSPTIQDF